MRFLLDILFPKKCVGCREGGGYFCSQCILDIPQKDLICPTCKRVSIGGSTHPICVRKYGLDGLWSFGAFQNSLRRAIQKIKYKWVTEIAEILVDEVIKYIAKNSSIFLEKIKKDQGQSWLVTAVPLHQSRQNWRGFNQSELLGRLFAGKLGLKYENILVRTRNTKPQVSLTALNRRANIKNAFSLKPNIDLRKINILLIDDVWTTGSTMKECGYLLKKHEAHTVWAITLAR